MLIDKVFPHRADVVQTDDLGALSAAAATLAN
jgi:hypothetical protein